MNRFFISFLLVFILGAVISAPKASAYTGEPNQDFSEAFLDVCEHYNLDSSLYTYIGCYSTNRKNQVTISIGVYPFDVTPSIGIDVIGPGTYVIQVHFENGYFHNGYDNLYYSINESNRQSVPCMTSSGDRTLPYRFYGDSSIKNLDSVFSFSYNPYPDVTSVSQCVSYSSLTPPTSSVNNNSDFDLLNGLYNITFVPKSCSISNSSTDEMLDKIYECTLVPVRSDNGYNMLSIQCPALAQNQDIVYYGKFTFHLRKADTSISDGSLSFAVDVPISQPDEPNFYIPKESFFKVKLLNPPPDGTLIDSPVSFTVNSLSFLNSSGSVCRYSSRSMLAFDYSGDDLYSLITFTGAVGSNMYSAGSFVYNFGYTDIITNGHSLPPEDIDKIKEEGRKHSDDTKRTTGYVPKYNAFPDTSSTFTTPNLTNYDFTSLADIFNSLFNDYVINLMMISVSVGIVGYILFGRGD